MATRFANLNRWNIRVSRREQRAIELLLKKPWFKNRSDIIRTAIQQYTVLYLTPEEYEQIYNTKPRKIQEVKT